MFDIVINGRDYVVNVFNVLELLGAACQLQPNGPEHHCVEHCTQGHPFVLLLEHSFCTILIRANILRYITCTYINNIQRFWRQKQRLVN